MNAQNFDGQWSGSYTPLELRRLRRSVKQTASLVSTNGQINTRPDRSWYAELESRTIGWRPTLPMPPFGTFDETELLALIGHEASHLNYSGGWDVPEDIKPFKDRFHHIVNAAEDIRIERLCTKELPGFDRARRQLNGRAYRTHRDLGSVEGMHLVDQAAYGYLAKEMNFDLKGFVSDEMVDFVDKTWERVSRISNSDDSAALARGMEPIFRELNDAQDQGRAPDADGVPSDCDKEGNDEPSENPTRSPITGSEQNDSPFSKTVKEILGEQADDAPDAQVTRALREMADEAQNAESDAEMMAEAIEGKLNQRGDDDELGFGAEAGRGKGKPGNDRDRWSKAKDGMRPQINQLSRKLQTTLRTNAADDWQDGLRRGQLDPSRAWKSEAGYMNVFRDRSAVGALDYTFAILLDRSGSMHSQIEKLLDSAVLMGESLDRAGLPFTMIPWDDQVCPYKAIYQPLKDRSSTLGRYIGTCAGGTTEGYALVQAQEQLARVRSGHKVLITVTDGRTNHKNESKTIIQELMDSGVRCISISIGGLYADHYPQNLQIHSAADLTQLLPKVISQIVKKGGQ